MLPIYQLPERTRPGPLLLTAVLWAPPGAQHRAEEGSVWEEATGACAWATSLGPKSDRRSWVPRAESRSLSRGRTVSSRYVLSPLRSSVFTVYGDITLPQIHPSTMRCPCFSTFPKLRSHHHGLVPEHSHHPRKRPAPMSTCSVDSPVVDTSHVESQRVPVSAPFHAPGCPGSSRWGRVLSWPSNIPSHGWTTLCLPTAQVMHTQITAPSRLLGILLL